MAAPGLLRHSGERGHSCAGSNPAGADGVDPDALRRQLLRQRPRQPDAGVFRSHIRRKSRLGRLAPDRGGIHNRSTDFAERSQTSLRDSEGAVNVDIDDPLEGPRHILINRREQFQAGIVDKDVQRAEAREGRGQLLAIGYVGSQRMDPGARRRGNSGCRLDDPLILGEHVDGGPGARKCPRHLKANSRLAPVTRTAFPVKSKLQSFCCAINSIIAIISNSSAARTALSEVRGAASKALPGTASRRAFT